MGVRPPRPPAQWVQATPNLFPGGVPGLPEASLTDIRVPGGSLERKLTSVMKTITENARHLENMSTLYKLSSIRDGSSCGLPKAVQEVVESGTYTDRFLAAYDGQVFQIHCEEIAPDHEYRYVLEVHCGGKYWAAMPGDAEVRHNVEVVAPSTHNEVSDDFGSAQRGVILVWRWHHVPRGEMYDIPSWLTNVLGTDGHDPLRKLRGEHDALSRWEQHQHEDIVKHVRQSGDLKDPYIKELLKLWPTAVGSHGSDVLKKTAVIEGLKEDVFLNKTVLVVSLPYDDSHTLCLHAMISRRRQGPVTGSPSPPGYRLTTAWRWSAASSSSHIQPLRDASIDGTSSVAGSHADISWQDPSREVGTEPTALTPSISKSTGSLCPPGSDYVMEPIVESQTLVGSDSDCSTLAETPREDWRSRQLVGEPVTTGADLITSDVFGRGIALGEVLESSHVTVLGEELSVRPVQRSSSSGRRAYAPEPVTEDEAVAVESEEIVDEETKATSVELVDESQSEVGPVTKEATEVTRSSDLDVDQKDHAAYLDGRGLCAGMSSSDESLPERARNVAKNAKAFATKTRDRPKPLSYVARLQPKFRSRKFMGQQPDLEDQESGKAGGSSARRDA